MPPDFLPRSAICAVALLACNAADSGPPALNPVARHTIAYATYLGGPGFEEIREPLLREDGSLLFGARTKSRSLPTTPGAYQPRYAGGSGDSYLAHLSPDGSSLLAASYFGGSGMERPPYGIAVDSTGDIVFTSGTTSNDLPTSNRSYRARRPSTGARPGGGYVAKISADLSTLRWCTYIGGGWPRGGLALDRHDNPIVVGKTTSEHFRSTPNALQSEARGSDDAFVLKLSADGTRALFATRLGGSGDLEGEVALTVRTYPSGDLSLSGITTSPDFPVTSGAAQRGPGRPKDGWLAKLDASGSRLLYSTLLSGSHLDSIEHRHALADDGSVIVVGGTNSPDLPITPGALQRELRGGKDGLVARLDASGTRFEFLTLLGWSGAEHLLEPALDTEGRIHVVGATDARDLPTTPDALQPGYGGGPRDGVLVILSPDGSELLYASYLGGGGDELIRGIELGPNGEIYLVGLTTSDDFPVTEGALQTARGGREDGFVVKLVPREP